MANGFKKAFIDLTEVMRSLNSVYQLMPIYKVLQVGSDSKRIAEVSNLLYIVQEKAKDALAFHREIEEAVKRNQKEDNYHRNFATVPFVGVQQPTHQSAVFENNKLSVSRALPALNLDFEEGEEWQLKQNDLTLEPGLYRIKVQANKTGDDAPNAVHDLFEVADVDG